MDFGFWLDPPQTMVYLLFWSVFDKAQALKHNLNHHDIVNEIFKFAKGEHRSKQELIQLRNKMLREGKIMVDWDAKADAGTTFIKHLRYVDHKAKDGYVYNNSKDGEGGEGQEQAEEEKSNYFVPDLEVWPSAFMWNCGLEFVEWGGPLVCKLPPVMGGVCI